MFFLGVSFFFSLSFSHTSSQIFLACYWVIFFFMSIFSSQSMAFSWFFFYFSTLVAAFTPDFGNCTGEELFSYAGVDPMESDNVDLINLASDPE